MDNPKKCKWAKFNCEYPDHDCCSADCAAYCKKEQQRIINQVPAAWAANS